METLSTTENVTIPTLIESIISKLTASGKTLTVNEYDIIKSYLSQDIYFGENYSSVGVIDLIQISGKPISSIKGIVGSLVRKNVFRIEENGSGFQIMYIDLDMENIIELGNVEDLATITIGLEIPTEFKEKAKAPSNTPVEEEYELLSLEDFCNNESETFMARLKEMKADGINILRTKSVVKIKLKHYFYGANFQRIIKEELLSDKYMELIYELVWPNENYAKDLKKSLK